MSYFSRLTDIVTCNLQELLKSANDPKAAISQIVAEMEEGYDGAQRSVRTAQGSVERLQSEIGEHRQRSAYWYNRAKTALQDNDEGKARSALLRKGEVDDLLAGLTQQLTAAEATREQLSTTMRALQARLLEARRTLEEFSRNEEFDTSAAKVERSSASVEPETADDPRSAEVEKELEELRRSLQSEN